MARKGKDTSTDSSLATRQLSPNKAKASILHALKIKRPIFLWGGPGIGKSDVVRQIAKTINAHVIDIRLSLWEPTDIKVFHTLIVIQNQWNGHLHQNYQMKRCLKNIKTLFYF